MKLHTLGFPRIGAKRELKLALEDYWQGNINKTQFLQTTADIRQKNWSAQQQAGIELLPVGDFANYDHVLSTSLYLGIIPERFAHDNSDPLDLEFRIARGRAPTGCACAASDMTKWFNTNYHYIVPELSQDMDIQVDIQPLLTQIDEARQSGHEAKPVILGPLSYLYLSAFEGDKLQLLPQLLAGYQQIFDKLNQARVSWLQIDEPILGLELDENWQAAFRQAYGELRQGSLKLLLTSYFASVDHHLDLIASLPLHGVHLDCVAEPTDIQLAIDLLPRHWVVSLGVIDGRNIWKTDLSALYEKLEPVYAQLNGRTWLAPSCSLLHCPVDLEQENTLDPQVKGWLAFASQKCHELSLLKDALLSGDTAAIEQYSAPVKARLTSREAVNKSLRDRLDNLKQVERSEPYPVRKQQQQALGLPLLPTTTIGSFPQTAEIRQIRAAYKRRESTLEQYTRAMQQQIQDCISRQEEIGLDVLVHGEPERNDMVEYFAEFLDGVTSTRFGWVQSYGSRCVKPPVIYGDVRRTRAMTTDWLSYAQSLTDKPVKGMLTGPVTILCWSFVRDDLSRDQVARQIALAVSDEVEDLIRSGIKIIQIDEPAIREGMPIKQSQWQEYLNWAVASFRLASARAPAPVQIHSHMCYSEFNDILDAIIALDADVLTVETSRSNMVLLDAFKHKAYPNDIGPGVYDIHSPNVPDSGWITNLLKKALEVVPAERLWINPDCGLKTRGWEETRASLENMIDAARQLRKELAK
ncbi:5-methyltetrahydropteroyltriglutamate--homocysteine S-methyltransferase [Lacimicrobium alkaliphilum]|uniref:5-methyltetrahydropteroyltriglutamate--homocysteine methyltransferase n=1 Tax=Lacimicrobium alkaliphilum TaxID=1526571 RepID=A0ABQ1QWN3_9ALTE|nr:5-methyltetrahydropteroyltriglutamate--homocysteine S-methyltransferase [Lacimicrobium alkaliphilum]GGD50109.1 5-methyltetrahydropteroyltriglutamate--homocysteine methyltransferase [Lacimicrobium alkaliphilum]